MAVSSKYGNDCWDSMKDWKCLSIWETLSFSWRAFFHGFSRLVAVWVYTIDVCTVWYCLCQEEYAHLVQPFFENVFSHVVPPVQTQVSLPFTKLRTMTHTSDILFRICFSLNCLLGHFNRLTFDWCILHMFVVCYLTTLSVSGLYSVDGRTINEHGTGDGMRIGSGIRHTQKKPAPVPLCPPQIPHDLTLVSNPGRRDGNLTIHKCYDGSQTTDWFSCYLTTQCQMQGYIEWDEMRRWLWMVSMCMLRIKMPRHDWTLPRLLRLKTKKTLECLSEDSLYPAAFLSIISQSDTAVPPCSVQNNSR
jgi:hypothetical protein